MGKKLVLIGGGHAHMMTLAAIGQLRAQGHQVTVIGPEVHHYYSGMGPGMLGTTYSPEDIRFKTKQAVERQGGAFIQDKAVSIDPKQRQVHLAGGGSVPYDVLSCNAGSFVDHSLLKGDTRDIFTVKPIHTLLAAQRRLVAMAREEKGSVAIVGGGPSSCEIAGNILQLTSAHGLDVPSISIFCRHGFLERFPDSVRNKARKSLTGRGVNIHENVKVTGVRTGCLETDGADIRADIIFLATGVLPSAIFKESGLSCGPDGGLLVNRYLQSPEHPEIFGGGDCIYFQPQPLAKVGVYAVRQNPVLLHNLQAALNGGPLKPFEPGGSYLLIFNMGQGLGLLHKGWLTIHGKLAFRIKDHIDRKFMRKFQ